MFGPEFVLWVLIIGGLMLVAGIQFIEDPPPDDDED